MRLGIPIPKRMTMTGWPSVNCCSSTKSLTHAPLETVVVKQEEACSTAYSVFLKIQDIHCAFLNSSRAVL